MSAKIPAWCTAAVLWLMSASAFAQGLSEAAPSGDRAQASQGAAAAPRRTARNERSSSRRRGRRPPSLSVGFANGGALANGVALREDHLVRHLPGRPHHHGTEELVALIRRAASAVARDFAGSRLTVGDLSDHDGGPIGHHASHQSGRDVDLAFYVTDARSRPIHVNDYISFNGQGRPIAGGNVRFDVARNWSLVSALLDDPAVRVEHIFVSTPLRALLLAHARAIHARPMLLVRAQLVLHQPVRALPHSNHFHVRIACPSGDAQCVEGVRPRPRPRQRARVAAARQPRARATVAARSRRGH
jgi:penicillin-insensitive murein endopeptidase